MDYILIILSVIGFTGQFALMKVYEKNVKQTLTTELTMIAITNAIGVLIFFAANGLTKIDVLSVIGAFVSTVLFVFK